MMHWTKYTTNPTSTLIRKYKYHILLLVTFLAIFLVFSPKRSNSSETVLLTGGLGFIGSNLVDELLVDGYNVVILDNESTGHNHNSKAITIIGDITNPDDFKKITYRVDYIIHFAAAISVAESMTNPEKYEKINTEGSRNVLRFAAAHQVKKIVSASSAAVYGTPKILPVDENTSLDPISPYASTKLDMEKLHKEFNEEYGIDAICLRFFNVYGPRQDPTSSYSGVISKFLDSAVKGSNLSMFGDGSNTRDFVFVKDIARANIAAIKHGKGFKVYNVGTETVTTLNDLAKTIIKVTESKSVITYKPERPGDIKDSLSNSTKIHRELGWSPQFTLEQGLRKTYNWYKAVVII